MNNTESSFIKDGGVSVDQRKMNAVRAYFEWMPIRQVDMDDNLRIWYASSIQELYVTNKAVGGHSLSASSLI